MKKIMFSSVSADKPSSNMGVIFTVAKEVAFNHGTPGDTRRTTLKVGDTWTYTKNPGGSAPYTIKVNGKKKIAYLDLRAIQRLWMNSKNGE